MIATMVTRTVAATGQDMSETLSVGSTVRVLAWLAFLEYILLCPSLKANDVLWGAAFVAVAALHLLICDAQRGIREMMSLHNAIWLGLIIYALPIYVLGAITDISVLLEMDQTSLDDAARLSFISIAVAGLTIELLRPWAVPLHRVALRRIADASCERQFYVAAVLAAVYGANYLTSGALDLVLTRNRFEITQAFETGKMWLIQYLMTGVTIAFIYQHFQRPTIRRRGFYIGLVSIVLFWAMYLSLGNRRGILTVVLAAAVCFVARSANGKRTVGILLLTFAVAGLIGILRQDTSAVVPDQAFLIGVSNFLGEFIYPGFTLVHMVELGQPPTFEFTWLSMLYEFISAQLQGQSFAFLAHRFALDVAPPGGDIMGFAYLPITEAFLNFGTFAAVLSGAVMLTSVMFLAWIFQNKAWMYLILLSLTLDMNRSEFVAMVLQFTIIAGGFLLTTKIRFNR